MLDERPILVKVAELALADLEKQLRKGKWDDGMVWKIEVLFHINQILKE